MHASDGVYEAAFSAALQVAAINGVRGLLVAECEMDSAVESICVVLANDGTFEVTTTDGAGRRLGGYSL